MADFPFSYSGAELLLMGRVLGYSHLLLPNDPFRGWLVEEIAAENLRLEEELLKGGHIIRKEDGTSSVPSPLAEAIHSMATPQVSLLANQSSAGKTGGSRQYHSKNGLCLWVIETAADQYRLEKVAEPTDIVSEVRALWALPHYPASPHQPCELAAETFQQARTAATREGEPACLKLLISHGVPRSGAVRLAKALTDAQASGALLCLGWTEGKSSALGSIAYLDTGEGFFLVRPHRQQCDWIVIQPGTDAEILQELTTLAETSFYSPVEKQNR